MFTIGRDKLVYLICLVMFFFGLYVFISPRTLNIQHYYDSLKESTTVKVYYEFDEKQMSKDVEYLRMCKANTQKENYEICYQKFYVNYTIKNGPDRAYAHLSRVMEINKDLTDSCHYVSHGIGEGAYIRFGKDINRSFEYNVYEIFPNITSCANGFYHGVTIGLTRDVESDQELYDLFKDFCSSHPERSGGAREESCSHGLGHAIVIYYNYDRSASLDMCDKLFLGTKSYFGCLTGVMMEYQMYAYQVGLVELSREGLETLCSEYDTGSKKREACIIEGSGLLRNRDKYVEVSNECQNFEESTERKACMKLNVIHAIRLDRDPDVTKMCKLSKNFSERVECTAFFAAYLSGSIDLKRKHSFKQVVRDVCSTLPLWGYYKCLELNVMGYNTFQSDKDYGVLPSKKFFTHFYRILMLYN